MKKFYIFFTFVLLFLGVNKVNTLADTLEPFVLNGSKTIIAEKGVPYKDEGATYKVGDVEVLVLSGTETYPNLQLGTFEIQYTYTDALNQTFEVTRYLKVVDTVTSIDNFTTQEIQTKMYYPLDIEKFSDSGFLMVDNSLLHHYNQSFELDSNNYLNMMVRSFTVASDQNIVLVGSGYEYDIIKLNNQYQVIKQIGVDSGYSTDLYDVIETGDGKFVAVGSTNTNGVERGVLVQFDQNIDNILQEVLPISERSQFKKIIKATDGSFFILGETRYGSNNLIAKYDQNFKYVWHKLAAYNTMYNSIIETREGDLLIAGQEDIFGMLLKVNLDGDVISKKNYNTLGKNNSLYDLIELENNQIIAVGKIQDVDYATLGLVAKINADLSLVSYTYKDRYKPYVKIVPYSHDEYLIMGRDPGSLFRMFDNKTSEIGLEISKFQLNIDANENINYSTLIKRRISMNGEYLASIVSGSEKLSKLGVHNVSLGITVGEVQYLLNQSINVIDSVPPVLSDLKVHTVEAGSAMPNLLEGITVTDNYSIREKITVNVDNKAINLGIPGTYKVKYEAYDETFNKTTKTIDFIVVDTKPPVFPEITELTLEATTEEVKWIDFIKVTDNSTLFTINAKEAFTTQKVGTYQVIFIAKDNGNNQTEKSITVHIVDTTQPKVSFSTSTFPLLSQFTWEEIATLWDNSGEIISYSFDDSQIKYDEVGDYPLSYTAVDVNNNVVNGTQIIKIIDTKAPIITVIKHWELKINSDKPNWLENVKIEDNAKTEIEIKILDNKVKLNKIGKYKITIIAIDESGNESEQIINVRVVNSMENIITTVGISVAFSLVILGGIIWIVKKLDMKYDEE